MKNLIYYIWRIIWCLFMFLVAVVNLIITIPVALVKCIPAFLSLLWCVTRNGRNIINAMGVMKRVEKFNAKMEAERLDRLRNPAKYLNR